MQGTQTFRTQEAKGYSQLPATADQHAMRSGDDRVEHLREQRAATWELIRKSVPDLARILELWDAMIAEAEGSGLSHENSSADHPVRPGGPYSGYDNAADALVAFIQERGPTPRLEAMHAVVSGGWAHDEPDAMGLMRDAVNYQLKRSPRPKVRVLKGDILDLA